MDAEQAAEQARDDTPLRSADDLASVVERLGLDAPGPRGVWTGPGGLVIRVDDSRWDFRIRVAAVEDGDEAWRAEFDYETPAWAVEAVAAGITNRAAPRAST